MYQNGVIRDFNSIIKVTVSGHMANTLIIIVQCMVFQDSVLLIKNNKFLNLEIEGGSKIVIDSYNKNNIIFNSIMLLMKDI